MTKILIDEATVKQVLEALECTEYPQDHYDAITALREALASEAIEQPAQQEPEHIVRSNGRYSPLLTRMMNERVKTNVKQVIHLYDEPPKQPAQRTWVEVESIKWDGTKLMAKLKENT